jgi:arylsulfatase A
MNPQPLSLERRHPVRRDFAGLRKLIYPFGMWCLVCAGPFGAVRAQTPDTDRPNIVLIVVDDLGYGDLGCYGNRLHKTPNMDRLASGGMRFTDFHTNGPVCSPTRAALMTGQYQQRSGVESAIGFTLDEGLPLAKTTLAELLAQAGYVCGVFGKWHLGHVSRFGPNDQGFHVSYCSNNSPDYHTHVSRVGQHDWYKNHATYEEPGYLTHLITKHTRDFIAANRERPMFAFVSHIAVHFPFQGPGDPPHRTRGKIWHDTKYGPLPSDEYRRAYRDMLESVDESVGAIVAEVERWQLRDRTLILILSDNGAYSWVGSNGPFRGQKGDLFEGGHRVPAIANWPHRITAGSVSDATVMTMDLLPTLLALTGTEPPPGLHLDGQDISHVLLRNEPLDERSLFWRFGTQRAARRGPWKLLLDRNSEQLFHLKDDSGERYSLTDEQPQVVERLRSELTDWETDVALPNARKP